MRRSIACAAAILVLAGCIVMTARQSARDPVREAVTAAPATMPVTFTIHAEQGQSAISPYIYGSNTDLTDTENFTFRRLGGNRMTGYNWENDASNAGVDYMQMSDDYLCGVTDVPDGLCGQPGSVLTAFHDKSLRAGAESGITIPLVGYVAHDMNGMVADSEKAPSDRWDRISFSKDGAYTDKPDTSDGVVYVDEEVQFLLQQYGRSSDPNGVMAYELDNEPGLFKSTHPLLHPEAAEPEEIADKSIEAASMVKRLDPGAQVFGGELYGFMDYYSLQDAPDWNRLKNGYVWFVDYYLDRLKQASDDAGKRLLDVLSLHYYSEAQAGDAKITSNGAGDIEVRKARVQAPRSLWDPDYVENSWIGTYFRSYLPIIPRVQQSIQQFYQGTKLAFTEYNFGGESDISGGLAAADTLGIFGKQGVYAASVWQLEPIANYLSAAFKLYRNFDGHNGAFGDMKADATTTDIANSSVYASTASGKHGELHIVALNKSFTDAISASIRIDGKASYRTGEVWGFDASGSAIVRKLDISGIVGNRFTYTLPPLSAYHIVLNPAVQIP